MRKAINEILQEINDNKSLGEWKRDFVVIEVLKYAFEPNLRFRVSNKAVWKETNLKAGSAYDYVANQVRKFHNYVNPRLDIKVVDNMFGDLMEALDEGEGRVMLAVRRQILTSLYPNITRDFLIENGVIKSFMDSISPDVNYEDTDDFSEDEKLEEEVPAPVKKSKGRPKKPKSATAKKTSGKRGRPRKNPPKE